MGGVHNQVEWGRRAVDVLEEGTIRRAATFRSQAGGMMTEDFGERVIVIDVREDTFVPFVDEYNTSASAVETVRRSRKFFDVGVDDASG